MPAGHERTRYSIRQKDLRNAMPIKMNQVPESASRLENQSENFDPFEHLSCKAATHLSFETIIAANEIRVRDAFLCTQKPREPLSAYPVRDIMQLSKAVASVVPMRGGMVFLMD